MPIEVKSSKQHNTEEEPRKRLDFFTRDRVSQLPVQLGMVVIAFAAYFRDLLSPHQSQPVAPAEKETVAQEEASSRLHVGEGTVPVRRDEKEEVARPSASRETPAAPDDTGSRLDWSPSDFVSEPIEMLRFNSPQQLGLPTLGLFPAAFNFEASNDNTGPAPGPRTGPRPTVPANPLTDTAPPDAVAETEESGDGQSDTPQDDQTDSDGDAAGETGGGGNYADDDSPGAVTEPGGGAPDTRSPANRSPHVSGPIRLNDIFAGQTVLIGVAQLLRGAHDPDDDELSLGDVSATGGRLSAVGSEWAIETEAGMLGSVTLSYEISDGEAAIRQTAHFSIVRNVAVLSREDDLYVATPYDDDIIADSGDDIVEALNGNDLILGGLGADRLIGGDGDDVLRGGAGSDTISGGEGDDIIHGGGDDDRLFAEAGDDTIFGDAGSDSIYGGDGHDILHGGEGNDRLDGGPGRDRLVGGVGDDRLNAGSGDDVVIGGEGHDVYEGGEGHDTLDYAFANGDLIIDESSGESSGPRMGDDTFAGFEQINGGQGDDLFVVGASALVLSGAGGRDVFVFEVAGDRSVLVDEAVHDILDFVVGDRIRVRDYGTNFPVRATDREHFRSVYIDNDDDWLRSDIPTLVDNDHANGVDMTIVRADLDNDGVSDMTINIHDILLTWSGDPVTA